MFVPPISYIYHTVSIRHFSYKPLEKSSCAHFSPTICNLYLSCIPKLGNRKGWENGFSNVFMINYSLRDSIGQNPYILIDRGENGGTGETDGCHHAWCCMGNLLRSQAWHPSPNSSRRGVWCVLKRVSSPSVTVLATSLAQSLQRSVSEEQPQEENLRQFWCEETII